MRKFKRFWKYLFIGIGLTVAILLIVNGIFAWRAERRFALLVSELREVGEPVALKDLQPTPVPPEENAAFYLQQITPQLADFHKRYYAFYETPIGLNWDDEKLPNAEELAAVKPIVEAFPEILAAIPRMANASHYASLRDFNVPAQHFLEASIDHPPLRTLARFTLWQMNVLTVEGKRDDAVRLGIQMLRLSRNYHEPLLVQYLISVAVRAVIVSSIDSTLRQGPISPEVRQELENELAKHEDTTPFLWAMRSERAFAISLMREQLRGVPGFLNWPMKGWYANELECLDRACNSVHKSWHEVKPEWDEVAKKYLTPFHIAGMDKGALLGPALSAAANADARKITFVRCLRVLNELGAYQERTGREAERLDELSLPTEAITDPWTGKPLLLKRVAEGWVIYSAWDNGKDDGGDFKDLKDYGLAPAGYAR